MEAARYSENSVSFYQNTLRQVSEDSTLRSVGLSGKLLPAASTQSFLVLGFEFLTFYIRSGFASCDVTGSSDIRACGK